MKPSKTITWLFEEGTFVPNGKLVGEQSFSIQSNYLGTPEVLYNADGKVVWNAELDAYGDVQNLVGERTDCPFRYQGQYEDRETGLYYNRFRYYLAEEGMYISQDPIGLDGGIKTYGYVHDPNTWVDILGLAGCPPKVKRKNKIDLRKRGAAAAFNGQRGVYIHHYKSGRVYVGQAKNLGTRPKTSLAEVPRKNKKAKSDKYTHTTFYVFDSTPTKQELDNLEAEKLKSKGGHHSNRNYNQRAAPNQNR